MANLDRPTADGGVAGLDRSVVLARPRLLEVMGPLGSRRLTVLVAGAGYGKSGLARQWVGGHPVAWLELTERHRPAEAFASLLADALERTRPAAREDPLLVRAAGREAGDAPGRAESIAAVLAELVEGQQAAGHHPVVVLDDVHELAGAPAEAVIAGLVRQLPAGASLVLASRTPLPFPVQRLRARGEVLELAARDLAFDLDEVGALLEAVLGAPSRGLAATLLGLTDGWPAAARLLVEALRLVPSAERPAYLERQPRVAATLFPYLAEEVFGRESPGVIELVRRLAPHPEVDLDLCAALGLDNASTTLADLERRGLFVARTDRPGAFTLHRLVRDYAAQRLPLAPDDLEAGQRAAVGWAEGRGDGEAAIRAAMTTGDGELIAAIVARHASSLLARGRADGIIEAVRSLPESARPESVELALADALAYRGRSAEALDLIERIRAGRALIPRAIAWRLARVHLELGSPTRALDAVESAAMDGPMDEAMDAAADAQDVAMVLAHRSLARYMSGQPGALEAGLEAVAAAERPGAEAARSIAHTGASIALLGVDPERAAYHRRVGLAAAEAAGDVVQVVRLRNADDDAPLDVQLEQGGRSIELIETAGNVVWLSRSLISRGLVAVDLGLLEVAAADFERARRLALPISPTTALMPTAMASDLARVRGDLARAEQGFRGVIEAADAAGDIYLSPYARAGLARVLARSDPAQAEALIRRCLADALALHRHDYVLAAGWVAAVSGRQAEALELAEASIRAGREPGRVAMLASSLELRAVTGPAEARTARLGEALARWEEIGNPVGAAAARLAIAAIKAGPGDPAAVAARRELQALGIRDSAADAAGLLAFVPRSSERALEIRLLGGFSVLRAGLPISLHEWQSRKSRDLLKILATRRTEVPREELGELLWPDEPPGAVANRLSVALSVLRLVLDPDRAGPADGFVTTGRSSVGLRREALSVDVDGFVSDARAGLDLLARGRSSDAAERLASAEARYGGDLLPEEAFAEWAISAREEARALYGQVTRALAELAAGEGTWDAAERYLMRAIAIDPFDEPAHLSLVGVFQAARRHGEARRAYEQYARRMAELEVEPAPYQRPPQT